MQRLLIEDGRARRGDTRAHLSSGRVDGTPIANPPPFIRNKPPTAVLPGRVASSAHRGTFRSFLTPCTHTWFKRSGGACFVRAMVVVSWCGGEVGPAGAVRVRGCCECVGRGRRGLSSGLVARGHVYCLVACLPYDRSRGAPAHSRRPSVAVVRGLEYEWRAKRVGAQRVQVPALCLTYIHVVLPTLPETVGPGVELELAAGVRTEVRECHGSCRGGR
mmetsp:Transcript_64695/g.179732  ORF Transcript_64695/g.179732 Transcript_64695/m.179732 type:complete len:218 (+) Transcript_64695:212-865(+)